MKKLTLILLALCWGGTALAQVRTEPVFPTADAPVRIIYDATQGSSALEGIGQVYIHTGVITSGPTGTTWSNVVGNWGQPDGIGAMTAVAGQTDQWEITLTPNDYYPIAEGETIFRLGMVFREAGPCDPCAEGKSSTNGDIYVDLLQDPTELKAKLLAPLSGTVFAQQNEQVAVEVATSISADLTVTVGGNTVASTTGTSIATTVSSATAGTFPVEVTATAGNQTLTESFQLVVVTPTVVEDPPAGTQLGLNIIDQNTVRLALEAPGKANAYVIGDFTDWEVRDSYQMKQSTDGEVFWLEVTGLSPDTEYGYMYLVDQVIRIADPYSDLVLDPFNDQFIDEVTYPNLKPYPAEAPAEGGDRVSVFTTNPTPYNWQVTNFERPKVEDLIIYELLVRDFVEEHNYLTLIDTLDYLENLGVNAIELMPIMEFSGNESWGYNPNFMFAVDKYYGTRDHLKAFIDECHARGMAVILDMVMNQNDWPAPMIKLYGEGFGATADNPWFNQVATHPFNVFTDFNHESPYTQRLLDSVNLYWLQEYRFDGYRFDLSKGFTQRNSGQDVGFWTSYDASRVAILKRMYDEIRVVDATAYVILEHFGSASEETELANYGMMFWNTAKDPGFQNAGGYTENSSLESMWYRSGARNFNQPHSVGYIESHDEERQMVRLAADGRFIGQQDTRVPEQSLERIKAISAIFYSIPGPKMLWQFGELGYDVSIDFNGRTGNKPVLWEYRDEEPRYNLYRTMAEIFKLKTSLPVFETTNLTGNLGNVFNKRVELINPANTATPSSLDEASLVTIANFDINTATHSYGFPFTGTWYRVFSEDSLVLTNNTVNIEMKPGEFRMYVNYPIDHVEDEIMPFRTPRAPGNLTAEGLTDTEIRLAWDDHSGLETGYEVVQVTAGGDVVLASLPADATSYVVRGLATTEAITFRVSAVNDYGGGASTVVGQVGQAPAEAPATPGNFAVELVQEGLVRLTWTASAGEPSGYSIERSEVGGSFEEIAFVDALTLSYDDELPTISGSYEYRMRAVKGSLASDYTETLRSTPVGVDPAVELELQFSPNPSQGAFYAPSAAAGQLQLRVFDLQGRQVDAAWHNLGHGLSLDLSGSAPGVYLVRVAHAASGASHLVRVVKR